MATNSSEHTLSMLPNELLIMIICSCQWTEDIDELRFLWEELRLVSRMFKEIVEDIFAARDISNPTALLRLLPTATMTLEEIDYCEMILSEPAYGMKLPFNRLLADGTAIFRVNIPTENFLDFAEVSAQFFDEAEAWGFEVSMGGRSFLVLNFVDIDLHNMEVSIAWKDLYSAFCQEMEEGKR